MREVNQRLLHLCMDGEPVSISPVLVKKVRKEFTVNVFDQLMGQGSCDCPGSVFQLLGSNSKLLQIGPDQSRIQSDGIDG